VQARAQRTRNAVIATAAREFSSRGFAATTTKSIADAAGVATGSVYQYFADKSAILLELAEARLARIAAESVAIHEAPHEVFSAAEARRRLRALSELMLALKREDPGLDAVLRERRFADPRLQARWLEAERGLLRRITALLRQYAPRSDAGAFAVILFGAVDGATDVQLEHQSVDDAAFLDALVDALFRLVFPTQVRP
jgi:AcrR family transcriptional regulator